MVAVHITDNGHFFHKLLLGVAKGENGCRQSPSDGVEKAIAKQDGPTLSPPPREVSPREVSPREVTVRPTSRAEPTGSVVQPTLIERRFGFSALMASFAIGISIGIVFGLVLAKIFLSIPQPTRIMPVVPPKRSQPAKPTQPEKIDPAKQIEPIEPISD